MEINFKIQSDQIISEKFKSLEIKDFSNASIFIKNLPYKRNSDKENILCLFDDFGGTCSTKHSILKKLADENNCSEMKLMLGIFRMNAQNTPKILKILEKYNLQEIPEAHNYLKFKNEILDFTNKNSKPENFIDDLVEELEIKPNQITNFKVNFHKSFIENYLKENQKILYNLERFWAIREECIAELQK